MWWKSIYDLEKEIRKYFIRTHIETFGKGPEDMWVKINRNIGTFFCSGTLTFLEENLRNLPDGPEELLRLRKKIFSSLEQRVLSDIESISGIKVLHVVFGLCMEENILYGAILFKDNVEDVLKAGTL